MPGYLWHGVSDPGQDFNGTWRSLAFQEGGRMQVEYRIPWCDFGFIDPPSPGELWAANVIRVQFTPHDDGKLVHREFSAGKLLWRYFHRIQDGLLFRFGSRE